MNAKDMARTLALEINERTGWYDENKLLAAIHMVTNGMGDWEYVTAWSSGTTLWRSPLGDRTHSLPSRMNEEE